jgi:uncharacterized pyridoxamine 5'-phosphate oxidase family protein
MDVLKKLNSRRKKYIEDILRNNIVILCPTKESFIEVYDKTYDYFIENIKKDIFRESPNVWDIYKEKTGFYMTTIFSSFTELMLVEYDELCYVESKVVDIDNIIWGKR